MNVRKKITGKPKRFPKATRDLADKDSEGRVVIYERAGIRKKYLSEIPVTQAADVAGNIESVLSESFGGGMYELNLVSGDSEVKSKYNYDIAGNPKGRRQTSSEDQQTRSSKKSSGDSEALVTVLGKLADAAIGQRTSYADEWNRALELARELKGDDGEYRQMMSQMLSGVMQNALTQGPMDIENALQIIQLSRELGPTLHQDDSMSSLLNIVAPFLLQAFGPKGTGGQPQLTPEQMQMIQPYLQQLSATQAQPLPPGQASQTKAALSSPQAGQQVQQAPAAAKPPQEEKTSGEEDHIRFYRMFIDKFREAISKGASYLELAKKIILMVQYSVDFMSDDPHPWMIGILENTSNPAAFATELFKFFERIPELAGNKEHQEGIRQAMILYYTGQAQDDTDDADTHRDDSDSVIEQPEEEEASSIA